MSIIHPQLQDVFYFTGGYSSVPNCPIRMQPHYNPSNGAMYFQSSDSGCNTATQFGLPFFLEKYGPRFQEWSVNGHEARPGHHFQYQGLETVYCLYLQSSDIIQEKGTSKDVSYLNFDVNVAANYQCMKYLKMCSFQNAGAKVQVKVCN